MAVVFGAILFVSAGTIAWPAGWAFLVLFFCFVIALSAWLLRFDPGLLEERMTGIGKSDQKTWDKVLLGIMAVACLVRGTGCSAPPSSPAWSRSGPCWKSASCKTSCRGTTRTQRG